MEFLWELKLYEIRPHGSPGFRVVINGDGCTVKGQGSTVATAFRAAEVQLVRKPPFVPFENQLVSP